MSKQTREFVSKLDKMIAGDKKKLSAEKMLKKTVKAYKKTLAPEVLAEQESLGAKIVAAKTDVEKQKLENKFDRKFPETAEMYRRISFRICLAYD